MRYVMISDVHIGEMRNSTIYHDAMIQFIRDVGDLVREVKQTHGCQLWITGDLFENRDKVDARYVSDVYEVLSRDLGDVDVHILLGNHDHYYRSTPEGVRTTSIPMIFRDAANITVYDNPTPITIDGNSILVVPWLTSANYEQFVECMGHQYQCIIGHFDIIGAMMGGDGTRYMGGSPMALSPKHLSIASRRVISGHYHPHSDEFYNDCGLHLTYVGSSAETDFGDAGGFHGAIQFDENFNIIQHFNNRHSPKHYILPFPGVIPEYLIGVPAKIRTLVNIEATKTDPVAYDAWVEKLSKLSPVGKITTVYIGRQTAVEQSEEITVDMTSGIRGALDTYLDSIAEGLGDVYSDVKRESMALFDECSK